MKVVYSEVFQRNNIKTYQTKQNKTTPTMSTKLRNAKEWKAKYRETEMEREMHT